MTETTGTWRDWIGRSETAEDVIDPQRARAMQATLDLEEPPLEVGDPLPPLWHWLYFWVVAPASGLGPDGHPARGGFLPPIALPRRMWAGSRLSFPRHPAVGAAVSRRSEILDVAEKRGRSGRLAFVTVRHVIADAEGPCIEEQHDIVYREAPAPGSAAGPGTPASASARWQREIVADPVLLFRYSALTFNGHRIHYDHPYVTGVEGYPGLIVHGPLLATLMVELVRHACPEARVAGFEFRALRPIFDGRPFTVAGRPAAEAGGAQVWIADPEGCLAMDGRVALA